VALENATLLEKARDIEIGCVSFALTLQTLDDTGRSHG
jgi:hypothetical protein